MATPNPLIRLLFCSPIMNAIRAKIVVRMIDIARTSQKNPDCGEVKTPLKIRGRPIPTTKLRLSENATPSENPVKIVRLDRGWDRRKVRNSDEL